MDSIELYDRTKAVAELRDFFGDIAEEEINEPAIVVAVRRLIGSIRESEECVDDPRTELVAETLETLLKPVSTENLLDLATISEQIAELNGRIEEADEE